MKTINIFCFLDFINKAQFEPFCAHNSLIIPGGYVSMNTMKKVLIIILILLTLFISFGLIYKFGINKNSSTEKVNLNPSAKITPSKINNITLTKNGFEPNEITVNVGTEVVWVNESGQLATVDSNPHPIHTDHSELNLGEFGNGEKINIIFRQPGVYKFHNHYNSEQGGTIIVK